MRDQALHVLLVDSEAESVRLLEEAFTELEEGRFSRGWPQPFSLTLAADADEAVEFASGERFDAVLLNLGYGNGEPLPAFMKVRLCGAPIILLADAADEHLALSLVRQGAQDYVLWQEFDAWPFARVLRTAVERQRLGRAQRSVSLNDELTGLYNERGFRHLAGTHARLGARHGLHLLLSVASLAASQEESDLADLDFTEQWRSAFEPTDLVARVGSGRFAAASLVASHDEALALQGKLARMEPAPMVQLCSPSICKDGIEEAFERLMAHPRRPRPAVVGVCDTEVFDDRAGRHL